MLRFVSALVLLGLTAAAHAQARRAYPLAQAGVLGSDVAAPDARYGTADRGFAQCSPVVLAPAVE